MALSIDSAAFGGTDTSDLEVVPIVHSEDFGAMRPVEVDNGSYVFGGAKEGAADSAPHIMDMITPDSVSQSEALDYSADELATLPFVDL